MKRRSLKSTLAFLSLATLLLHGFAQAQLGISPSMNSQFLTELRARSPKYANESRDVLGADRQTLENGRAVFPPRYFFKASDHGVLDLKVL